MAAVMAAQYPIKHDTFSQCRVNIGPALQTHNIYPTLTECIVFDGIVAAGLSKTEPVNPIIQEQIY